MRIFSGQNNAARLCRNILPAAPRLNYFVGDVLDGYSVCQVGLVGTLCWLRILSRVGAERGCASVMGGVSVRVALL